MAKATWSLLISVFYSLSYDSSLMMMSENKTTSSSRKMKSQNKKKILFFSNSYSHVNQNNQKHYSCFAFSLCTLLHSAIFFCAHFYILSFSLCTLLPTALFSVYTIKYCSFLYVHCYILLFSLCTLLHTARGLATGSDLTT